jgi:hypothetical protein
VAVQNHLDIVERLTRLDDRLHTISAGLQPAQLGVEQVVFLAQLLLALGQRSELLFDLARLLRLLLLAPLRLLELHDVVLRESVKLLLLLSKRLLLIADLLPLALETRLPLLELAPSLFQSSVCCLYLTLLVDKLRRKTRKTDPPVSSAPELPADKPSIGQVDSLPERLTLDLRRVQKQRVFRHWPSVNE